MGLTGRQFILGVAAGLSIAFIVATLSANTQRQLLAKKILGRQSMHIDLDDRLHGDEAHQELDVIAKQREGVAGIHLQEDKHMHHDDDSAAKKLYNDVRVLVWIMTAPKNLPTKTKAVRDTWAKRANKVIFFSSETDPEFPTVGLDVEEGRQHLTAKTMQGFRYVYEHHRNEADWFMKADDDTFVIMENLRYFLSEQNSSDPVWFGHLFKTIVKQGYYSGGGGYVLSKEALTRLVTKGNDPKVCAQDGGAEDAELGKCMEKLGVKTANTTDAMGRSRFHCFNPETHLLGGFPSWFYKYDAKGGDKGQESISDYAISFHYVAPNLMRGLEFYIYHLRPYGIINGNQHLNAKHENFLLKRDKW